MRDFITFNFFIIGVYVAFSIGQLLLYIFTRRNRVNLFMAVLGIFAAIFLYFSSILHFTESIEHINSMLKYQISFYLLQMGMLFIVIHELNGRSKRNLFYVVMSFLAISLLLNFYLPNGIIYEKITGIEHISFFDIDYNLFLGTINSIYYPLVIVSYLLFVSFLIVHVILASNQKENERKLIFFAITGIYLLSNIYDVLIDLRIYKGVFLTEYFMLPVLLLLNLDIFLEIKKGQYFESSYKKVQENFNFLIDSVELVVIALDLDGNITYVNPYFSKLTGYGFEEVSGVNFKSKFVEKKHHEDFDLEFVRIINKHSEARLNLDFPILTKEGVTVVLNWSHVPVEGLDQQVFELLSVGSDITERIQSRDKIVKAYEELNKMKSQLEDENTFLKENLQSISNLKHEMIGQSATMNYVHHRIDEVAATDTAVLIEGETGVGKELVARSIHDNSNRSDGPYIKVNCGALPKDLIESELFGHVKGAFTGAINTRKGRFELADGGTIFLDEIGELPMDLQSKLLRVLENSEFNPLGSENLKRVDVRVIAATNRNLKEYAEQGSFRLDLYYRLSVFPITVPPLRKRVEDIPLLVDYFLDKYCNKLNIDKLPVSVSTINKLKSYSWPGNVRELRNVIERSTISSISRKKLFVDAASLKENRILKNKERKSLVEAEREYIISILNETSWKISGKGSASEVLEINEATLRSKMKKLGISRTGINLS